MHSEQGAGISVVIPTHNEGENLVDTVGCVLRDRDQKIQVIVVDDGSTDGSTEHVLKTHGNERVTVVQGRDLGVAGARNLGAGNANGQYIVFIDAHCYLPEKWLEPLVDTLSDPSVGLAGPAFANIRQPAMRACGITWNNPLLENVWLPCPPEPQPTPFHIGACQAFRAEAFRAIGGYDDGMTRWGSEDIEICLRMWLCGYSVYSEPRSLVYHLFRDRHPYTVNMADVIYNRLRMATLHFDERRLARTLSRIRHLEGAESGLARVLCDDTVDRRKDLLAIRTHDIDWLFDRFGIEI